MYGIKMLNDTYSIVQKKLCPFQYKVCISSTQTGWVYDHCGSEAVNLNYLKRKAMLSINCCCNLLSMDIIMCTVVLTFCLCLGVVPLHMFPSSDSHHRRQTTS